MGGNFVEACDRVERETKPFQFPGFALQIAREKRLRGWREGVRAPRPSADPDEAAACKARAAAVSAVFAIFGRARRCPSRAKLFCGRRHSFHPNGKKKTAREKTRVRKLYTRVFRPWNTIPLLYGIFIALVLEFDREKAFRRRRTSASLTQNVTTLDSRQGSRLDLRNKS